ncbi:MAG: thiamine ABC transporter substrate binding subunit [Beutenbergiaceae bacterium]
MKYRIFISTVALAAVTVGCSVAEPSGEPASPINTVRVVTHDSFALPEELIADFEDMTGYVVELSAPGDGGALVNQLILTKDSPLGDVAYGIDNTFASRALAQGVFSDYESPMVTVEVQEYAIGDSLALTPVDIGDVCFNVDHAWFEQAGIPEPVTFTDLTDPQYAGLTVVPNPATSSPGLAMLTATVGQFGTDGYAQFWQDMRTNGVKVVSGWSDAYYVDFSGSEGQGDRPIVLSYSTSPAFEAADGVARTGALLDTCFRQVEYAGVLAGAENVAGAEAFIDFLLSEQVQSALPENMYVYPIIPSAELPADWVEFAPLSDNPIAVPAEQIDAERDDWIETWTQVVID